jgi:thiamine biosynthesis protein ThiI
MSSNRSHDGTPPRDSILVRYGELGLKDSNRGLFEKQLKQNIQRQINSFSNEGVERFQGGMKVKLNSDSPLEEILQRIQDVPGIAWFAPTWETERSPESIAELVLKSGEQRIQSSGTFAVNTQRSDKTTELNSQEFNNLVGRIIDNRTDLTVDLDDPDWTIHIHILYDQAYIFFDKMTGFGGLPVEASGEVLSLLSGGIDSPVAAIKAFKRGCRVDFLHYYPYPSAQEALDKKMYDLLSRLTDFGTRGRIYFAPYHVYDLNAPSVSQRDELILFRRHLMRIANILTRNRDLKGVVTGSSIGQVASQTLENIHTISSVANVPVIRPLIGLDKQEIIELAKNYDTFATSIREYQDCCSIQSTSVRTRSRVGRFESLEKQRDLESVDQSVLKETSVFEYENGTIEEVQKGVSTDKLTEAGSFKI